MSTDANNEVALTRGVRFAGVLTAWLADKKVIPACYVNLSKDALPHPYSAIQALNLQSEALDCHEEAPFGSASLVVRFQRDLG